MRNGNEGVLSTSNIPEQEPHYEMHLSAIRCTKEEQEEKNKNNKNKNNSNNNNI